MLQIQFTSKPFDKLKSQCAIATVFSDCKPLAGSAALLDWRLNGRISRLMLKEKFEGNFGESLLLPSEGRIKSKEILLLGLGPKKHFDEAQIASLISLVLDIIGKKRVPDFLISFEDFILDRFEWRNSVRLVASKLHDYPVIETVRLCESDDCVREARRRHMDFGFNVDVTFETQST